MSHIDVFSRLDVSVRDLWRRAQSGGAWRSVLAGKMGRDQYRRILLQLFHYTRHNAINQAVAAFGCDPDDSRLLRFVLRHAREELGHEQLLLFDLRSSGLLAADTVDEAPLPATSALIDYLYGVALRQGPIARLGYSYWAESVYEDIAPLLDSAQAALQLTEEQMTFFRAHAAIDARHATEVRDAIRRAANTPERAEMVCRVAVTSLWLTLQIFEQALAGPDPGWVA